MSRFSLTSLTAPLGAAALAVGLTLSACHPAPTITDPEVSDPTTAPAPALDRSIIELPVAADPSITFAAWFQVGSQDDPPGKEGLAWLTAQLIADGGSESHSYQELLELLYPMAAGWGVRVDREMTTITGRSHKETAEAFQTLLGEQLTRPAFATADLERLRSQGLNYLEKNLRYASDEELGKAGLEAFVFEGTPYAHPPVGSVAGLSSITLDDVRAFHAAHYTRDRVVFAIGGGYSPEQRAALEATGELLPQVASATPVPAPSPAAITDKQLLLIDKPGADASISFGHPIDVHRGDPDFYALWLANSWLGEHRNSASHLFQVIREVRGLNYGDYSYVEAYPEGGSRSMPPTNVSRRGQLFQVWIRTLPNEQAHFALRAAHRELTRLVDNGLTQEQFELTRGFLRKYVLHFADTTGGRLGYAIDDRFYGLDGADGAGHLAQFQAALDAMTLEQVNAALKEHIHPEAMKFVIVTGEAESLRAAIVADAPATIEYPTPKAPEVLEEDKLIGAHPLGISAENTSIQAVDAMFAG